jgi:hypothetical protein
MNLTPSYSKNRIGSIPDILNFKNLTMNSISRGITGDSIEDVNATKDVFKSAKAFIEKFRRWQ